MVSDNAKFGFVEFAEKLNGRAAMLGFTVGLIVEAVTGQSVIQQLGFCSKATYLFCTLTIPSHFAAEFQVNRAINTRSGNARANTRLRVMAAAPVPDCPWWLPSRLLKSGISVPPEVKANSTDFLESTATFQVAT
eukprot:g4044.t1